LNISDLNYLLNKPEATNEKQTIALENVVLQYPYFQAARALHLKGLFNQESFRYNYELKKTAAYTTDRTILFEFITSENFTTIQQEKIDAIQKYILDIDVHAIEKIIPETNSTVEKENEEFTSTPEDKLGIGVPISFSKSEKHSFQEWLQLTKLNPIQRDILENGLNLEAEKQKKIALIDKFIEANPKIPPIKDNGHTTENNIKSIEEPTHLMTETLAKVYLEQKKYNKAIQAYEILILKYPEKSSFFADQINEIKNLQQNNN
jgi:tetratricopeptide (TPR) repeat protein